MTMMVMTSFGAADLNGALEEACVALGYGDPSRRAELMDALTNGVPDDVVAQVVATRGGDRGHVAQELARQAGPFREALKRVAIAARLGRKIDKDRDAEAGGDDLTDEDIVQRLREMGPCPMGFAWHREGWSWRRCGGAAFRMMMIRSLRRDWAVALSPVCNRHHCAHQKTPPHHQTARPCWHRRRRSPGLLLLPPRDVVVDEPPERARRRRVEVALCLLTETTDTFTS